MEMGTFGRTGLELSVLSTATANRKRILVASCKRQFSDHLADTVHHSNVA